MVVLRFPFMFYISTVKTPRCFQIYSSFLNSILIPIFVVWQEIPVACVYTGVKHLHHKAQEFDIGIYFEANGHGTVLFNKKAKVLIKAAREEKRQVMWMLDSFYSIFVRLLLRYCILSFYSSQGSVYAKLVYDFHLSIYLYSFW